MDMTGNDFDLTPPARFDRLEKAIHECRKCRLCETRNMAVPGDGSREARIMFVGEGPGKQEDIRGIPFCGAAGSFLDELLASIKLDRRDIYITNIVKCRPPGNRDPQPDEMDACLPFLREQFLLIKPKLVCTLGRFAGQKMIDSGILISRDHGRFFDKKGHKFCALYHPAAALYNNSLKEVLRNDFLILGKFLEKASLAEENN